MSCMGTLHTPERSSILIVHDLDLSVADRSSSPDLYGLYDLAHVAGWDPYNLHDLSTAARVSSIGTVLRGDASPAQTASHSGW